MTQAINQALKAQEIDEVPVGAVIVYNDKIIATGHNTKETNGDPTCHAEITAIKEASKQIGNWRLIDCDIYITLEPCPMCAGAIIQSRIKNVYYGAYDYKCGCGGTIYNILNEQKFNHRCNVYSGILEEDCVNLLKNYFADKRKNNS